jgi:Transposase, Mutator family
LVAADALVLKVREGGRVVSVHAPAATGDNADGHREIVGIQAAASEHRVRWLAFFRDLTTRADGRGRTSQQRRAPRTGLHGRSHAREPPGSAAGLIGQPT